MVDQARFLLKADDTWMLNGHRWLLNKDLTQFFTDNTVQNPESYSHLFVTDRDTGLSWTEREAFVFQNKARKTIRLEGQIGLAVSAEPSNWGSFLFRVVPKLAWLKAVGVSKILMYSQFPQQAQLAGLLGFTEDAIIPHHPNCSYEMSSAIIPSQCHTNGYLDAYAREVFLGLSRSLQGKSRYGRKIYISRRGGVASTRARRCINEDEVCEALVAMGFDVVVPDELSVIGQLAAFANADFIVGPAGAGMFNSVFCAPGTKLIDIESERHWVYAHCNLFSSLGLNFGVFWGRVDPTLVESGAVHLPFSVNVPALLDRIAKMDKA
ncbi:DUF563 domain-containing protein [Massilia sp. Mn16-1_5]|uniref:glycosyltransferase family 61 protein n=1 Tax=Massilia sp. Mn16-1_5 TaxID=2079199 RepID=UPI0014454BD0|nr:glycosyltransferase family 61 protein [Massilia sp. Mn16-1_5]